MVVDRTCSISDMFESGKRISKDKYEGGLLAGTIRGSEHL